PGWGHQAVRASSFCGWPERVPFAFRIRQNACLIALNAEARRIKTWGSHEYRTIFFTQMIERLWRIPSVGPIESATACKDDGCLGIRADSREDLLWQAHGGEEVHAPEQPDSEWPQAVARDDALRHDHGDQSA